jgi:twitching motility protein PilT
MDSPIENYLRRMIDQQASDLFLQADQSPAFRIHGRIEPTELPAVDEPTIRQFVERILTPLAQERFGRSPDLDLAYTIPGVGRFRINLFMTQGRLALVARSIPLGAVQYDTLNLPPVVLEMADRPHGLILVVGPTGCGKSTTLAALVHHINAERRQHIVCVEDPIEFVHEPIESLIHQRQVGYDTESFSTALRHIVRQNPDVILIGEMRDRDTIETALSAALTGHLILTTLHTTNVVQSVDRMLNYFPAEARKQAQIDLATTLIGIMSMRLLPRADSSGRIPACEVLVATSTARRLLAEGGLAELYDLMKRSGDAGMQTMNQALHKLVADGLIDERTALAASPNADELRLNLSGMFTGIDSIDLRGSIESDEEEEDETDDLPRLGEPH